MTSDIYDQSGFEYKSVRLFLGPEGNLQPIPVKHITSWCGGESWIVETDRGILNTHSVTITWNGKPVLNIDRKKFNITHTNLAATVKLKPNAKLAASMIAYGGC
jgi:hypothetical protein